MNQFLMALGLIVAMLIIYINVVENKGGIKENTEKSHNHMTEYIQGIDA